MMKAPWLVMRDFNQILTASEKGGREEILILHRLVNYEK